MNGPPLVLDRSAAIVHDWFQGFHGSERVVETLRADVFQASTPPDIYTFVAARDLIPAELGRAIVRESRLARLPGLRPRGHTSGFWRHLLPYMTIYFAHLDLARYDLVIASSHACAHHARPRNDAVYICYCHTPMRYVWLPDADSGRVSGVSGKALGAIGPWLKRRDRLAARRPTSFVANSRAVAERIRRFYGRDSVVIHPPVDVSAFRPGRQKDPRQFLWVNRLVPYKRPLLVARAFANLPYRLTMVGVGPLDRQVRANLPPNVELRPWVSRAELTDLFETASGFVHVAEEDFGITMVEALASGTPVIALNRGGATDIVEDERDGVLLDSVDHSDIRRAVIDVACRSWEPHELAARARRFSTERFVAEFTAHVRALTADA